MPPLPTLPRELVLRLLRERRSARQRDLYLMLRRFGRFWPPSHRAILYNILERQTNPNAEVPMNDNVLLIRRLLSEYDRRNRGVLSNLAYLNMQESFGRWYGMAYGNHVTRLNNPYNRQVRRRGRN